MIGIANFTVKPLFLLSVKVQCSQGGASHEFLGILTSQKRQRCWPVNPLPTLKLNYLNMRPDPSMTTLYGGRDGLNPLLTWFRLTETSAGLRETGISASVLYMYSHK